MPDTKLYDIMGVDKNVSADELKSTYKKLAKKYHPDKNPEHGDQFKEISFAYEILSDPEKRETYDRYGLDGLKEGRGGADFDPFGDMFGGFFGGLFGGGGMRRGPRKGQDTIFQLPVSLEDLYNGKTSKLQMSRTVLCKTCKGAGSKSGNTATCSTCRGRGVKVVLRQLGPGMVQQMQIPCSDCDGEGEVLSEKDRCKACSGKKTTKEKKVQEVHIDKGMIDGHKIPLRGQGDEQPGIEPGDVVVVLAQKEHELFTRKGADLYCTYNIGITEALCGFEMVIQHLDKRELLIKHPSGQVIQPEMKKCIHGEGMPTFKNPFSKGDLIIRFTINFPENGFATEDQLTLLEKLLPARPPAPAANKEHEEVELHPYTGSAASGAGNDDDDDDEMGGGGPKVQCAHQ